MPIIDTGYSELLVLPSAHVRMLDLPRQAPGQAVMADGVVRTFDIHLGEIEWDGVWRPVFVSSFGVEALVGMRLLARHELRIVANPGGSITITPVP
jgi:predicted aspartyl protease